MNIFEVMTGEHWIALGIFATIGIAKLALLLFVIWFAARMLKGALK